MAYIKTLNEEERQKVRAALLDEVDGKQGWLEWKQSLAFEAAKILGCEEQVKERNLDKQLERLGGAEHTYTDFFVINGELRPEDFTNQQMARFRVDFFAFIPRCPPNGRVKARQHHFYQPIVRLGLEKKFMEIVLADQFDDLQKNKISFADFLILNDIKKEDLMEHRILAMHFLSKACAGKTYHEIQKAFGQTLLDLELTNNWVYEAMQVKT